MSARQSPFPQNTADVHFLVEDRLRQIDQRYTPGRRAVIELLITSGHPVNIGDIEALLPDMPRSSAYRHLVDLQHAGVVRRVAASDDFARFELVEELTGHHHHLLCTRCGAVLDITPSSEFERAATTHLYELAAAQGFQPQGHSVDVLGFCASCR